MISVCIPTYNGELYIKEQLLSILEQLSEEDEVIISDDSSTDNTVHIIEELGDSRVKILKNNHYKSPIYNLENALYNSKGEYIFTADQDDVWLPNKVAIMKSYLDEYDLVVSDAIVVDSDKNILFDSFYKLNHSSSGLIRNIIKNGFLGCCLAFKREIMLKSLPFPNPIPMHDTWIGLVAEKYGKTIFIPDHLLLYRRHGKNASSTSSKSKSSLKMKLYQRWLFLKNIIKR